MLFENVLHDHWKIHQANWEPTTSILFEIYWMVKTYMIPFRMVEFRKKASNTMILDGIYMYDSWVPRKMGYTPNKLHFCLG